VIDVLPDLFILRGVPAHIRSDNGPEFVAQAMQEWIAVVGAKTAYIERGSPWENGIESFNARLRDERSTARASTLCARPGSSSRADDATTTRSGPAPQSDTSHQHQGVRACIRRVAGCATPTGSAGHAGATANQTNIPPGPLSGD
jgi:hypothetical protein